MYIPEPTNVRDENRALQYANAMQNMWQFGAASVGMFAVAYFVKDDMLRGAAVVGGAYFAIRAFQKYQTSNSIYLPDGGGVGGGNVIPFPVIPTMPSTPMSPPDPIIR